MIQPAKAAPIPRRWAAWAIALGAFLSVHGYHSRDGDQAYRLPLLIRQQDASSFAGDPFVDAFSAFNPHGGYLTLLDWSSRPLGLSIGLFALFALTFALTCAGLDRLARAVWPDRGPGVGLVAVGLVLATKAGNIGTNHLFEATLLDRLIALALGWWALAVMVERPDRGGWRAAMAIGLASWVHPSLGLQLGGLLGASWVAWRVGRRVTGVETGSALTGLIALALALTPALAWTLGHGNALFEGLDPEAYRTLAASVQSPQHMLPHLWRMPQWLAWGCFPTLALLALGGRGPWPAARIRLAIVLGVALTGLGAGWLAVEVVGDLRITLLQPFRMATVARGLCLIVVAGRVGRHWGSGWTGRARAALIAAGLVGDWALVVATAVELAATVAERGGARVVGGAIAIALGLGLVFLVRHDTEAGHWPLVAALAAIGPAAWWLRASRARPGTIGRVVRLAAVAWSVPVSAWVAGLLPDADRGRLAPLIDHCRFTEVPVSDIERLAVWCREHTPPSARFIGPPGPKTFRLWSLRPLAFNRAASPYHAAGLADWAARFRDHVGFRGSTAAFARAYLADRQGLERRYQQMSDADRANLARHQGAAYVIAAPPPGGPAADRARTPLELLHVEGRYAVYRLRDQPARGAVASAGTG